MRKPDDWPRPRSKGTHFTKAEIAEIKRAYLAGESVTATARRLQCSSRNVAKYYGYFRVEGARQDLKTRAVTPRDRFYKSNFSL